MRSGKRRRPQHGCADDYGCAHHNHGRPDDDCCAHHNHGRPDDDGCADDDSTASRGTTGL